MLTDCLLLSIAEYTLQILLGLRYIDGHSLSGLEQIFHLVENTFFLQLLCPLFLVNVLRTPDGTVEMADIHLLPIKLLHLLSCYERRILSGNGTARKQ